MPALVSSNLVIGIATALAFVTVLLACLADRDDIGPRPLGETWSLRGQIDAPVPQQRADGSV